MSKKILFLTILIILIIAIGLTFGSIAIYRFCVIQNIFNKLDENIEIGNYSLKTSMKNNKGEETITQVYYKDGIGKNVASNGVYTWVDEENAYMVDESNCIIYVLDINSDSSITLVSDSMFESLVPGYNKNLWERILMACDLKVKIKSTKVDEQKCYMIEYYDQNAKKTVWITKDRKNPIKAKVEFENGDTFEYEYELKFMVTKLKDVELPDISNYTLINNETGEIILDKNINLNTNTDSNSNTNVDTNTINNTTLNLNEITNNIELNMQHVSNVINTAN